MHSMRIVEKRAPTVEQAIELGLAELGVTADDVSVEVVAAGRPGLFGVFGREDAVVRLTWQPDKAKLAADFVAQVADKIGVSAEMNVEDDDESIRVHLTGADLAVLIGRHGQTLDALQYVTNLAMARETNDKRRIIVDVEGYRQRRQDTLTRLAVRLAERVRRTGKPQALEPMPASERRIIHLALQDVPGVETRSEGEEPFRKIVIVARR